MNTLTKNKTPITLGTIVTLWHDTRGHNYVAVGLDKKNKVVHFIRHNSINRDGTIHAATADSYYSHKERSYNQFNIVGKVSTVIGTCARVDADTLDKHFAGQGISATDLKNTQLYTTALVDRRNSTVY